jgi:DnaJ-class molecular chaperone
VLEISSSAEFDEIKAAYKKKIWQYHSDKVSKLAPEFKEMAERKSWAAAGIADTNLSE